MKNFLQLSAALAANTKGPGVLVSRSAIAVCHTADSAKVCTVNSSFFLVVQHAEPGGAGSYLWSCRFSGFHDHPSKEICQSFENITEHARNGKTETCSRRHFLFGLVTLYPLLAIFNDSSKTIRTKGMKDQLCAIFLVNVVAFLVAWRSFAVSRRKRSWRFYIVAVVISRFIAFHFHTNQLFFSNCYGK